MLLSWNFLRNKEQTGAEMKRVIDSYYSDLRNCFARNRRVPLSDFTLDEFFKAVSSIPFKADKKPIEVVSRPQLLLSGIPLDCKKKSILICAWARCNGVPYKLIASSSREDGRFHHVFPMLFISHRWLPVDATYPNSSRLFEKGLHTKEVEI
jgi:hypothetical protein